VLLSKDRNFRILISKVLLLGNVGAALVAAHGKHKKSSLLVGGHKGCPYIFCDSALEPH
jgi:hypothetical protein